MKKKTQILAFVITNYLICLSMFILALVSKNNATTPFAFLLFISTTIIRFSGKSETFINIRKNINNNSYETEVNKPTFNLWEYLGKQYNRFIAWMKE